MDQKLTLKGPPANLAKEKDGAWSKAAVAFARKNEIGPDQLQIRDFGGGSFVCADVEKTGREALEILAELFPKVFAEIHWYKTMRWGEGEAAPFVRPVAWLTALLGDRVIPMAFGGVESGAESRGHRFLHNRPIPVRAERAAYLAALREAAVIADPEERKEMIRGLALEAAAKEGLAWRSDEELLDTVTFLVEYPVPVLGSFDPKLLEIPEEVLVSEMREHQKLFALNGRDGRLSHHFLAVSNMECRDYTLIREGNERVVRARFADAEFFLREDRKRPLADRRADLDKVAFLKDLGEGASIYRKTLRLENLAARVAAGLEWSADRMGLAKQVAALCKNDLTTQMVGEFPELQGLIGRYYALGDGLPEAAADGIADHYRPRNAEDALPGTEAGALVGLADRLDTLTALFAKGKAPTGSADPFALRRACWSAIALLAHLGIRIPLGELLQAALETFTPAEIKPAEREGLVDKLRDFFKGRAQNLFAEQGRSGLPGGVPADCFEAACGAKAPWEDIPGLAARLRALEAFRREPGFRQIAEIFKRVSNILKEAEPGMLHVEGLAHPAEKKLVQALGRAETAVRQAVQSQAWDQALAAIATLRNPVAELFDAVMVNDPDPTLRKNRQALLRAVRDLVLEMADFAAFQIA
jgi:glycyl-tRNA synthetase beta chain